MKTIPKVGIVVLNWNNAKDTIECLSSVFNLQYENYFVIVVDNGSTDDSVEEIYNAFQNIEILSLKRNTGYGGGNNEGISRVISHGADYILILNNDTVVAPSCLQELLSVAYTNEKIGMVGPKMYCMNSPHILYSQGSLILWKQAKTIHRGMYQSDFLHSEEEFPEKVDFIIGCGIMVSKKLIETIGGFDDLYYLNFEDTEWGVRAKRYGFEVWYAPKAVIWHKVSSTLGISSPANTYYITRNSLRFFWMNSEGTLRWISVLKIIIGTLRTSIAWMVYQKYRQPIYKNKRKANLLALRDFFLGQFGEMRPDVNKICYGK